jgi:hypothetical protein
MQVCVPGQSTVFRLPLVDGILMIARGVSVVVNNVVVCGNIG